MPRASDAAPLLAGLCFDTLPLAVAQRGLSSLWRYVRPIESDGSAVRASFSPHDDPQLRAVYHCTVRRDLRGDRLLTACTCFATQPCAHAARLLVDLSLDEVTREALAHRGARVELTPAHHALRERARRDLTSTVLVRRWLDEIEPAAAPHPPLDFQVEIEASAGVIVLLLDARAPGQRARVDLCDPAVRAAMTPDDRSIAALTQARKGARRAAISGPSVGLALALLRARGARDAHTGQPLAFRPEPVRPLLEPDARARADVDYTLADALDAPASAPDVRDETHVDVLALRFSVGAADLRVDGVDSAVSLGPHPWVWLGHRRAFHPLDPSVDPELARRLCARPSVEVPHENAARVRALVKAAIAGRGVWMPIERKPDDEPSDAAPAHGSPHFSLRIEGRPLEVRAWLEARYDGGTVPLSPEGAPDPRRDGSLADALRPSVRDEPLERAAVHRVLRAGLAYDPRDGAFTADDEAAARFWGEGLASLRAPDEPAIELSIPSTLTRTRARPAGVLRVRVALVGDWLETEARIESEGAYATPAALRDALLRKRNWVVLNDGTLAKLSEQMVRSARDALELAPDGVPARLPLHQLVRVEQWVREGAVLTAPDAVEALRARLREGTSVGPARVPQGLTATLRPYQLQALAWLQSLDALRAGGVLADDMGLGKTVVALAYLLERREREGPAPSLVLCPTSVAGHWLSESARFTPSFRVLRASERTVPLSRAGPDGQPDLVVATYAWARLHAEALRETEFRCVFLDEAQRIKNPDAETSRAVRALRASQTFALSGTPVENRLLELWSVMDHCVRGLLGARRGFEARYEASVRAEPDGIAARHLRALIRPFVLRRTKGEVLPELPPRVEVELACPPGPTQRALYNDCAAQLRARLREAIARDGLEKSALSVLTALLRLRQLACDPRLLDRGLPASSSAKREVFLSLVRDLVAAGRRALVFSQFVELLQLWAHDLRAEGIAFEYLDGGTANRDAVVARFRDGDAPLFLLSLTAGGVGLNLTAADTVILCDPWWNPAVEAQAGDRAHRMGQTRAVTVYRLVARGTVEEKVLALQTQKRALVDAVVRADAGAMRGLGEDELRLLLGGLDGDDDRDDADATEPDDLALSAGDVRLAARAWLEEPGATRRTLVARALVRADELDALLEGKAVGPDALSRIMLAVRDLASRRGDTRVTHG